MRGQPDIVKAAASDSGATISEITQGLVRFDDEERIAPRVDVTAVTDYHRYDDFRRPPAARRARRRRRGRRPGARAAWARAAVGGSPCTLTAIPKRCESTLERAGAEQGRHLPAPHAGAYEDRARSRTVCHRGRQRRARGARPPHGRRRCGEGKHSRHRRVQARERLLLAHRTHQPTVTIGKRLAQRIRAYVTSGFTSARGAIESLSGA